MTTAPIAWTEFPAELAIARIVGGGTPSKQVKKYFEGEIPFMTVKDLIERFPSDTQDHISEEALRDSASTLVAADTVVVATRMALGKIVRPSIPVAINQDLKALYLKDGIDKTFFEYWWHSHKSVIKRLGTGTTVQGIRIEDIKALPFPAVGLAEQKRIAEKLDTLLARVDACRERLDRVPTLIKRFKQSVLRAATSGKLTEDWRGGKEIEWTFERATDVCAKVQSGGTPKEGFIDSPGIPFLKVYNIVDQQVAFNYKPQFVSAASHARALSKSVTLPGDVLMNIVGPPLGKVGVVPFDHPEWNINQAITLFRPSDRISTGWLYCILCGGSNIEEIVNETRGSAGQTNISLSQCRDFVFPVPSIEEQTELVRRVGKLFTIADRLQAKFENASNQVERLTPSLLAKAFRGELVPQDPNDESAQKLLERLKATKSAAPPKASPRGRKRTATT